MQTFIQFLGTIKDMKNAEVLHTTIFSESLGIYHKTVNKIYEKLHLLIFGKTCLWSNWTLGRELQQYINIHLVSSL